MESSVPQSKIKIVAILMLPYKQLHRRIRQPKSKTVPMERRHPRFYQLPFEHTFEWSFQDVTGERMTGDEQRHQALQYVIENILNKYGSPAGPPAISTAISTAFDLAWPMVMELHDRSIFRGDAVPPQLVPLSEYFATLSNYKSDWPSKKLLERHIAELLETSRRVSLLLDLFLLAYQVLYISRFGGGHRKITGEDAIFLRPYVSLYIAIAEPNKGMAHLLRILLQNFGGIANELYQNYEYRSGYVFANPAADEFVTTWYNEWLTRLAFVS